MQYRDLIILVLCSAVGAATGYLLTHSLALAIFLFALTGGLAALAKLYWKGVTGG